MNREISPWAGTPQAISSNPGYGNDTNVGFSPGVVGGVPAGLSKWIIQNRLYMRLYGDDIVAGAMVAPIFIMTLLTPMMLIAAAGVLWFADLFASIALLHAGEHGLLWHVFALALAAGGGSWASPSPCTSLWACGSSP